MQTPVGPCRRDLPFRRAGRYGLKAQPLRCLIDPDDDLFMTPNAMVDRIRAYCERTGQYVPKTHGEVARCVYESLAMKYRFALEGLEKITGIHMPVLHVVGGGCQNKALVNIPPMQ